MNLIHIADPQGRQQSYDPQEALRLWNGGGIPHNSLYWREGMAEWRPVVEYFVSTPAPPMPGAPPPIIPGQAAHGFVKEPVRLTRFLIVMLWVYLVASGLSALLSGIALATGQTGQLEKDEMSALDIVALLVGLAQLLIVLVTGIIFLMWIHRANVNARGLGAQGMTFTPGWSVGWYFIPIANLWKPYQAMKEIWRASANPSEWSSREPPALLAGWWTLWLITNALSNASFRMTMRADTSPELVAAEIVTLISDLMDVALCLVAIRLVREIIRLQTHWAAQGVPAALSNCGICRRPVAPSDMILLNDTWVCAHCKPVLLQRIRESGAGP